MNGRYLLKLFALWAAYLFCVALALNPVFFPQSWNSAQLFHRLGAPQALDVRFYQLITAFVMLGIAAIFTTFSRLRLAELLSPLFGCIVFLAFYIKMYGAPVLTPNVFLLLGYLTLPWLFGLGIATAIIKFKISSEVEAR